MDNNNVEGMEVKEGVKEDEHFKFYLSVKPITDRILIFEITTEKKIRYITEMVPADPEQDEYHNNQPKIFNGTLSKKYFGQIMLFRFLGGEGKTSYLTNELFSKPITKTKIPQNNVIIINTPEQIYHTLIEIPDQVQKVFNWPKILFLTDAKAANMVLCPSIQASELLARGIDPQGKQFVKLIDLPINNLKERLQDIVHILDTARFTVYCYSWNTDKEITIDFQTAKS